MPSEHDRRRSRRRVLAALTASIVAASGAGCQQLPGSATATTGTDSATATSTRPSTTPDERTTPNSTRAESTTERSRTPACPDCELLETTSHDGDGIGTVLAPRADGETAAVAILDATWRETVDETELKPDARRFLEETDFAARTVVAVQYTEPGRPQTQRLTRYERDGDELHLALAAREMGALNAENDELALLRTNVGVGDRPTRATVTVSIGDTFELAISTRESTVDRISRSS